MTYRWLDIDGADASPAHRSPTTAGRWLARQAIEPRTRPAPVGLIAQDGRRRRPVTTPELAEAIRASGLTYLSAPLSARPWLRRGKTRVRLAPARHAAGSALLSRMRAGVR